MLNIVVFAITFALAQAAAGVIVMMFLVSKWYANKVTKMTTEMTKNMINDMEDIYK